MSFGKVRCFPDVTQNNSREAEAREQLFDNDPKKLILEKSKE